ncbi:MAG: hypothetical protein A2293_13360 [Elusimicrobia bacterium RIFOXYB2_FULL_49_7]|nr:MAG: hypothetical protein A2293_13360 [Elusimicrobia bacterium RIFOXYB2_FULL_49_7]
MLHWNFGLSKVSFSLGVEASYWNYYSFPKSIDFGIDFEKSAIRVYSELQTGLIFFGLSAGLVSEFKENNVSFGFQGSTWGNLYGGLDLRYRRINEVNFICPGLYAKCPFLLKGTWI